MSTMSEFIFNTAPMELLRDVYMEVVMAALAALLYFALTGYTVSLKKNKTKSNKKDSMPESTKEARSPRAPDVMKALRQGNFKEALPLLNQLSPGSLPCNIATRLLMAAAKANNFDEVVGKLQAFGGRIESKALESAASEASRNTNSSVSKRLHSMSVSLSIETSPLSLELLAQGSASDVQALRALVERADSPLPKQFAKVVLEACTAQKEVDLAMDVFEKVAETDAVFLRSAVEKAATGSVSKERSQYKSSLQHAKEVRDCAKNGDVEGAVKLFEQYNKVGESSILYNGVLDVCMESGDFAKAVHYFKKSAEAGLADTVSYNIMIKGCVNKGDEAAARQLLAQLIAKGLTPTQSSYHVLLNDMMIKKDNKGAWSLLDDMRAAGVAPSGITCSILLKGKSLAAADVDKILTLIQALDEPMDDVLFSAVVEACIRTGHLEALSVLMDSKSSQVSSLVLTAPTYGSMMKAYGQLRDVKRVWSVWRAMVSSSVKPTAITFGCMVEALVINRCTADALKLAKELREDQETRPLVNTVIYSTILKGFANMKETGKVMALYEEMKSLGVHPNTITYNTILNAFAQGGAMDRVPALLEDMKTVDPPAEPDIVTYSTIIKGFCQSGSLDQALKILKDMQSDGKFSPDEVLYNTLLDGCAREQRADDALKLLDDMRKGGVTPSNFTLSMLVKLMGRCRRLNKAFTLVDDLSAECGLKVNIQVYTCLIQACFNSRQPAKAIAVYNRIIDESLRPDEKTYSCLVSGCLKAGLIDKAAHLVKCAYGVAHPRSKGTPPGVGSACWGDVIHALGGSNSAPARALVADIEDGKAGKVQNAVKQLATVLESLGERQGRAEEEWRTSERQFRARLASLETGTIGGQAGLSEGAAEARPAWATALENRASHLEERLGIYREDHAHRLSEQDKLLAMRLEAADLELTACVKAVDLDSRMKDVKGQLEAEVSKMGQEVRSQLQNRTQDIHKDLQAATTALNGQLRFLDKDIRKDSAISNFDTVEEESSLESSRPETRSDEARQDRRLAAAMEEALQELRHARFEFAPAADAEAVAKAVKRMDGRVAELEGAVAALNSAASQDPAEPTIFESALALNDTTQKSGTADADATGARFAALERVVKGTEERVASLERGLPPMLDAYLPSTELPSIEGSEAKLLSTEAAGDHAAAIRQMEQRVASLERGLPPVPAEADPAAAEAKLLSTEAAEEHAAAIRQMEQRLTSLERGLLSSRAKASEAKLPSTAMAEAEATPGKKPDEAQDLQVTVQDLSSRVPGLEDELRELRGLFYEKLLQHDEKEQPSSPSVTTSRPVSVSSKDLIASRPDSGSPKDPIKPAIDLVIGKRSEKDAAKNAMGATIAELQDMIAGRPPSSRPPKTIEPAVKATIAPAVTSTIEPTKSIGPAVNAAIAELQERVEQLAKGLREVRNSQAKVATPTPSTSGAPSLALESRVAMIEAKLEAKAATPTPSPSGAPSFALESRIAAAPAPLITTSAPSTTGTPSLAWEPRMAAIEAKLQAMAAAPVPSITSPAPSITIAAPASLAWEPRIAVIEAKLEAMAAAPVPSITTPAPSTTGTPSHAWEPRIAVIEAKLEAMAATPTPSTTTPSPSTTTPAPSTTAPAPSTIGPSAPALESRMAGIEAKFEVLAQGQMRVSPHAMADVNAALATVRTTETRTKQHEERLRALDEAVRALQAQMQAQQSTDGEAAKFKQQAAEAVAALAATTAQLEDQLGESEASSPVPESRSTERPPSETERSAALSRVEARMESLAGEMVQVRQELREGLAGFGPAVPESPESRKSEAPAINYEDVVDELDKRSADRLEAVWRELKGYADASAVQAGQLEQTLNLRISKVEGFLNVLSNKGSIGESLETKEKKLITENYGKDIEWLNWRISWLEWATGGEKRGFARPVDEKAMLPIPPPGTVTATAFAQPLTEDMDLWVREPGGRQRLRRQIGSVTSASSMSSLAKTPSAHSLQPLRKSRLSQGAASQSRLQPMGQTSY